MKRALVTGSSKGIGLAICTTFLNLGYTITGVHRPKFDALDLESIDYLCEQVKSNQYDILVNCVGGGGTWGSSIPDITPSSVWDDVLRKNLIVAERLTMAAMPHMLKQKWGRIVTISSTHGKEALGRPWFTVAKASQIALMKSLSRAYLNTGVTFNTVCPGRISVGGEKDLDITPTDVIGQPDDVAGLVAFLCSDQAKHVNGACITVDGGDSVSY